MLSAGRFLTHTGTSRSEMIFWQLAAAIALLGALLAFFSEIIGAMHVVSSTSGLSVALIASGCLRLGRIYLLYKFIMGMAHALKEPFDHRKPRQ